MIRPATSLNEDRHEYLKKLYHIEKLPKTKQPLQKQLKKHFDLLPWFVVIKIRESTRCICFMQFVSAIGLTLRVYKHPHKMD